MAYHDRRMIESRRPSSVLSAASRAGLALGTGLVVLAIVVVVEKRREEREGAWRAQWTVRTKPGPHAKHRRHSSLVARTCSRIRRPTDVRGDSGVESGVMACYVTVAEDPF